MTDKIQIVKELIKLLDKHGVSHNLAKPTLKFMGMSYNKYQQWEKAIYNTTKWAAVDSWKAKMQEEYGWVPGRKIPMEAAVLLMKDLRAEDLGPSLTTGQVHDLTAQRLEAGGHMRLASLVDALPHEANDTIRRELAIRIAEYDLEAACNILVPEMKLGIAPSSFFGAIHAIIKMIREELPQTRIDKDIFAAIADKIGIIFEIIAPYIGARDKKEAVAKILASKRWLLVLTGVIALTGLTAAMIWELWEKRAAYFIGKPLLAVIETPARAYDQLFAKFVKLSKGWPVTGWAPNHIFKAKLSTLSIWPSLMLRLKDIFSHVGSELPPPELLDVDLITFWNPRFAVWGFFIPNTDTIWINLGLLMSLDDAKKIKTVAKLNAELKQPQLSNTIAHEFTHHIQAITNMLRPTLIYLPQLVEKIPQAIERLVSGITGNTITGFIAKIISKVSISSVSEAFYLADIYEKQAFIEGMRHALVTSGKSVKKLIELEAVFSLKQYDFPEPEKFAQAVVARKIKQAYKILLEAWLDQIKKSGVKNSEIAAWHIKQQLSTDAVGAIIQLVKFVEFSELIYACGSYLEEVPPGKPMTRQDIVMLEDQLKKKIKPTVINPDQLISYGHRIIDAYIG